MSRDDPLERCYAWAWLEFRRQQTQQTWQTMPTPATSIATPRRRTGQGSLQADQPAPRGAAGQPLPPTVAAPEPPGKVRSAVGTGSFSLLHRALIGCRHVAGGGSSTERRQQAVFRRLMPLLDDHPRRARCGGRRRGQRRRLHAINDGNATSRPWDGRTCPLERFELSLARPSPGWFATSVPVRLKAASSSPPDRAGCGALPAASSPQPPPAAFFPAALPLPRAPKKPPPSVLRSAPARP
jgi:hypothetical protein